ncbi:MAG: energy-coupling factor ABC transporter ATP-binding protein [Rectinemataceae bacterium]|jgi:energy-coupling factor transporter ATP-binding protein EcfA2
MSPSDLAPGTPVIRTVGLGHRFTDGAWAFRDINFSLFSGEIAVLAGRNGAGKTILAKHLAGLIEPTEGSVLISGQEMQAIRGSRAESIGYLFQDARLQIVGETILDDVLFGPMNLGLSPEEALSRAHSALFACGLADRERNFVHKLSGGELRRLAIAGVLAMMPKAIILDEPFANLDLDGVRAVLKIARDMADKGIAVLVVTHEIEKVLGLARGFSVMDGGKIVLSGNPAEVLAQGIEYFGLRYPFRSHLTIGDLTWLD